MQQGNFQVCFKLEVQTLYESSHDYLVALKILTFKYIYLYYTILIYI